MFLFFVFNDSLLSASITKKYIYIYILWYIHIYTNYNNNYSLTALLVFLVQARATLRRSVSWCSVCSFVLSRVFYWFLLCFGVSIMFNVFSIFDFVILFLMARVCCCLMCVHDVRDFCVILIIVLICSCFFVFSFCF